MIKHTYRHRYKWLRIQLVREFPGGPGIKALSSQYREHRFDSRLGITTHMPSVMAKNPKKKQTKNRKKKNAGEIWIQLWIVLIQYPGFDIVLYRMLSRWQAVVKNPSVNARDMGSNPGSGRSPRVGNGNTRQYSWLKKSMGLQRVGHNWACMHYYYSYARSHARSKTIKLLEVNKGVYALWHWSWQWFFWIWHEKQR